MPPTPENKAIAQYIATAFGGKPVVTNYVHDDPPLAIPLINCENRPFDGVRSFGTIGLSDTVMVDEVGEEFHTRLELVSAADDVHELFANVIAAAAFRIMRSQEACAPGSVFRDYVKEFLPFSSTPHLYFTSPFEWESSLRSRRFGNKLVSWMYAVPISDSEADFLDEFGDDAFESRLEAENANVFDLMRDSIV